MASPTPRLFSPGAGASPPALTGRAVQQRVLLRCLADLAVGASPPHDVVLIGPRGNGKTALLNWFQAECQNGEQPVDVVRLTPRDVPTLSALAERLALRRGLRRLIPRKLAIASIGAAEWSPDDAPRRNLTEELAARCRNRPLAVLLDEAHTLDADVGGTLLNASQIVRAAGSFLLVLAGTPGLLAHFRAMDASFWGRLGEGRLGVGLLTGTAAADALTKPLAAHGVSMDNDALQAVVEHSQRYPYFIQLWGDALWQRHLATGARALTLADATAIQPQVNSAVAEYYQDRHGELDAEGLDEAARAIALVFKTSRAATDHDIDDALTRAGQDERSDRVATREALNRLGYIWCPPGQEPPIVWRPGIPSLMAYVLDPAG